MPQLHAPDHVLRNAIALDDVEVLYVPVPRSGTTAILWALAESEGLPRELFFESEKLEVTRALTVHDLTLWDGRRLDGRAADDVERILRGSGWLRFTVVREPVRRLWSAWTSKILLREPRFVATFGTESWFPRSVRSADELVHAFRAFLGVLADRSPAWHDPHWSAQADLVGIEDVSYAAVARIEELYVGLAPVDERLRARGRRSLAPRPDNGSLLPFAGGLLDREAAEAAAAWTARDRAAFGYPELCAGDDLEDGWLHRVEAALPALQAVAERHERIGDLRALLRRSRVS